MGRAMRRLLLFLPLLFVTACESGLTRTVHVTIPAAIETQFTPTSPGLVVSTLTGEPEVWVVLCGQGLKQPLTLSQDLGFGCLRDDLIGAPEAMAVWIQPMAAPVDGLPCSTERSFYRYLHADPPDAGGFVPPGTPDVSWAQAATTANWRRDASPCGGIVSADLTLAVP